MASSIDRQAVQSCLERLASHSGEELLSKPPHWGDAIMCDGLLYAARALRIEAPVRRAIKWFEPKLAAGPDLERWFWFWSAEALPALGLYQATGKSDYLEYARAIVDTVEHKTPHTADGVPIPHPPEPIVWIDVVYFVAPAMALLGRLTRDEAMVGRALDQVLLHAKYLLDPVTDLFWHVANAEKRTHSPCLWARGNSWFSIACSQVLREIKTAGLEGRFGGKAEDAALDLARQMNAISALQDQASGLWHTVLEQPTSYLESSASAGFALGVGRALQLDLDRLNSFRARRTYERAISAICTKINSAGEFTGVSQQTPPGDFAHYQSIEVGTAPFGSGVCMMALAEALEQAP
jgi:unsaturated rhamnogalacturonyl hydrolase